MEVTTLRKFWRHSGFRFGFVFAGASILLALVLYYPALRGGFVFDDVPLRLADGARPHSIAGWYSRQRPVLMFSYGLNQVLLGASPASFRIGNTLIHAFNACLVFLAIRRLLAKADWPGFPGRFAALCGSLIFLVHPLQTESVSYIAGRSESLAATFLLLAYVVFLADRRGAISWLRSAAVLALFVLAVKTKENAVSLAGVLLLTDLMWPCAFSLQGVRRNWRLYALMLPGAAVAAVLIFRMLATAHTAGFSVANYTWYQYAFTEARAIFEYLQMAAVPIGQALDHDFAPSRTILDHGAVFYMAILALITGSAIYWRRRYPVACFGFLLFLVLLAPTSTVVPVDDAVVERRMYLPLLGLILIGCEAARRWRPSRPAAVALVTMMAITFGSYCYARNRFWGNPDLLIAQAAQDARYNPRPLLNVAEAMIRRNRCDLAISYLDRAERILPGSYYVHAIRGRALGCLGHPEEALAHLEIAARIQPCSDVFQWIGLVYGQMGRLAEAGESLRKAVELDPGSATAHGSLGLWYETVGDDRGAEREYAASLAIEPHDRSPWTGLERLRQRKMVQIPPEPFELLP